MQASKISFALGFACRQAGLILFSEILGQETRRYRFIPFIS